MAKVILHGGYPAHPNTQNNAFFQEMVKDVPKEGGVNILVVYFAKEEKVWEEKFQKEKEQFLKNANGKKLNLVLASRKNFIEEIKKADVVYLSGGKSFRLLATLKEYPEFRDAIKGKVVARESAGSNVLSKYFYSRTEGGAFEGLGIVPLRECPHYSGNPQVIEELNKYPNDLEMILLKDYEVRIFFID